MYASYSTSIKQVQNILVTGEMHWFNPSKPRVPQKGTLTNSADPDQTPQNAASAQDLHCLHLVQEFR